MIYFALCPKVKHLIRRVIVEQLANFIVLPNMVSVPFVHNIPMKVGREQNFNVLQREWLLARRDVAVA